MSATHQNPDAALLAAILRHDALWREWDHLAEADENDHRIDRLASECCELEKQITATPAFTHAGLAGKRRVVELAELAQWDGLDLIETIFKLDAERIAATAR
jgi:hypothetical protein